MGALFTAASSQYLSNAVAPVLTYPFSVGMWVHTAATNSVNRVAFSLTDTAATNAFFIGRDGSTLELVANAGGSGATATIGSALTAGSWHYVVGRFISTTNRRASVIKADRSTAHGQNTTSRDPTGIDTIALGARALSAVDRFWDGMLAEFWITNNDIQADAAQLSEAMLWQLAYGGPFSVPHVRNVLIDYRSLWRGPLDDDGERAFMGPKGRQVWVNTNGVTVAPHPPLPFAYETPRPRSMQAMF